MSEKSTAAALCKALRDAGIRNARVSPALIELAKLGGTLVDTLKAIENAGGADDPFAYGVTTLVNRMKAGGQAGVPAITMSPPSHAPAPPPEPPLSAEQLRLNGQRARQVAAALGLPVKGSRDREGEGGSNRAEAHAETDPLVTRDAPGKRGWGVSREVAT